MTRHASCRWRIDLAITGEMVTQMTEAYLAGVDAKHPLASSLYTDIEGLPPLLMQVGTAETLLDDPRRVTARAAGMSVTVEEYPDCSHVFQAFAGGMPEAAAAITQIGAFVQAKAAAALPA